MKIPQHKIDEIASSIDIVDVISAYTPLRKAGRSFMGRCPFHEEKTPSFSVSQEKGVYHCFGCGKSGNVFTFIMETESVSFFEAAKMLAEKANILLEFEDEPYDEDRNLIEKLYEINKHAAHYFYDKLMGRDGEYAREYLRERGTKEEMITRFGLGYSLRDKESLYKELSKEFSREELVASGLFLNLAQNEMRDRFRGRLMFPIISESNKVIGFGGRKLFESEGFDEAKYVNSPETKIYNKSRVLYGLNLAKNRIKELGFVLLVEGYMDLISLFQNGFENVVASSGTSLTALQVKILSRYTNEVAVVFDADAAGQSASLRAIELLLENNLTVNVVVLPFGEDPDTFLRRNGKDEFEKVLSKRQSVIKYLKLSNAGLNSNETSDELANSINNILYVISKIPNSSKRELYIKEMSREFSLTETSLRSDLINILNSKSRSNAKNEYKKIESISITPEKLAIDKSRNPQLELVEFLLWANYDVIRSVLEQLEIDFLDDKEVIKIIDYFFIHIDKPSLLKPTNIVNYLNDASITSFITGLITEDPYNRKQMIKEISHQQLIAEDILKRLEYLKLNREFLKIAEEFKNNFNHDIAKKYLEYNRKLLDLEKQILESNNRVQTALPTSDNVHKRTK